MKQLCCERPLQLTSASVQVRRGQCHLAVPRLSAASTSRANKRQSEPNGSALHTHNFNAPRWCSCSPSVDPFNDTWDLDIQCIRLFFVCICLLIVLFHLPVFRQWWRVTLETGQATCAMWTTLMAMGGVSPAYITLIKIGLPRYVNDVWRKCFSYKHWFHCDLRRPSKQNHFPKMCHVSAVWLPVTSLWQVSVALVSSSGASPSVLLYSTPAQSQR